MIQRIQSVYLALIFLLSILFMIGGFLTYTDISGDVLLLKISGMFRSTGGGFDLIKKLLPLSAFTISIPLLSLITIFLYKNRKIQLRLAFVGIILAGGLIFVSGYYSYIVYSIYDVSVIAGVKMVIPVVILVLSILAYRGIRKDDRLVKSYDRLR